MENEIRQQIKESLDAASDEYLVCRKVQNYPEFNQYWTGRSDGRPWVNNPNECNPIQGMHHAEYMASYLSDTPWSGEKTVVLKCIAVAEYEARQMHKQGGLDQ